MKNPSLIARRPTDDVTPPPRKLGETGMNLWRSIQSSYAIDDAGGIEMLLQICEAAQRAEACRAQIEHDGELIRSKAGVLKEHPLLKSELACRSFVVRGLARLGLDVEPLRPH